MADTSLIVAVVEDHDDLRELTVNALTEQGHRVVGLSCAEEVAERLQGQPIDVFVLDLNLPGEDGLSLAQRLRQAQPHVGVVMLTARTSLDDRLQGYHGGADVYLCKPIEVAELCAAVAAVGRKHLSSSTGAAEEVVGWCLDLKQMTLSGPNNTQVHMTHGDATLLQALITAPGRRMQFWQMGEALEGRSDALSKSNIEVRVARLRKKIAQVDGPSNAIQALRGEGYQLTVPVQLA
ncbi:OmpR Response regulators consisting of a CheY-like receiver domain and a winged-helix DNA-binding domain [Burkholderiaceae bacterium]